MKFNTTKESVSERTKTTNLEGATSYNPDLAEMSLYKVTINNLLEDNFYTDDQDDFDNVLKRFEACADENPEFVLQLAVHARNDMGLRDVSQLLLVLAANDERTQPFVDDYAADIMVRADEPCTVIAMNDEIFDRSLPQCLRRGIEDSLHNFDKYQYDKYDNTNREVNIRDVINRVHPTPRDDLREEIFERVMKGSLKNYPDVEPLDEADGATWETVISEKGNTEEAWREVIPRMGIFAKLKNARNMLFAGLKSEEIFTDKDLTAVKTSKMFPFRVYQSYKAVKESALYNTSDFDQWTSKAIDTTTENLPEHLNGTFAVADVSGSMRSEVSGQSNFTCKEIATLFTASLGKKGSRMGAFADDFKEVTAHSETPTLELVEKINNAGVGGGTNGYKVPRELRKKNVKVDRLVLFTDMQLWDNTSMYSDKTLKEEWEKYKEEVAPEAKLYMIDLQSYGDLQTPEGYEDVYNISGWTDKVIDFIFYAENEDEVISKIKEIKP